MEAIWKSNPDVKLLYCFDDGNCFAKHSDALSYKKETQKDFKAIERPKEEEEKQPTKPNKK